MIYTPQTYAIPDKRMQPFIDAGEIWEFIHNARPDKQKVREIIKKSLEKKQADTGRNSHTRTNYR
jgi:hypothetical protein